MTTTLLQTEFLRYADRCVRDSRSEAESKNSKGKGEATRASALDLSAEWDGLIPLKDNITYEISVNLNYQKHHTWVILHNSVNQFANSQQQHDFLFRWIHLLHSHELDFNLFNVHKVWCWDKHTQFLRIPLPHQLQVFLQLFPGTICGMKLFQHRFNVTLQRLQNALMHGLLQHNICNRKTQIQLTSPSKAEPALTQPFPEETLSSKTYFLRPIYYTSWDSRCLFTREQEAEQNPYWIVISGNVVNKKTHTHTDRIQIVKKKPNKNKSCGSTKVFLLLEVCKFYLTLSLDFNSQT